MVHIAQRYGDLVQMSYITADMDAAIAHAERELGFHSLHRSQARIDVLSFGRIRPLAVKSAVANAGSRQLEIIQPVSGAIEIYTDELDLSCALIQFHHIAIAVPGPHGNWMRLLDEVRESGDAFAYLYPAVPSPEDKLAFCYVDTRRRIGHYTEYVWADPSLAGIAAAPWLKGGA